MVAGAARELGKEAVMVKNAHDATRGISSATWIMVGNPPHFLGQPQCEKAGTILDATSPRLLWTDDYSSLLKALK